MKAKQDVAYLEATYQEDEKDCSKDPFFEEHSRIDLDEDSFPKLVSKKLYKSLEEPLKVKIQVSRSRQEAYLLECLSDESA